MHSFNQCHDMFEFRNESSEVTQQARLGPVSHTKRLRHNFSKPTKKS